MDINFVGENLLPGKIGQFFIVFSFGAAILSCVSYYFAAQQQAERSWLKMGRAAF